MFGSFGRHSNRASAYAKVGVETGVGTADPHQLILMLFDGALLQIRTAGLALEKQDFAAKGTAISKASEIIINGLKVSLDVEAGGELAERLAMLYDYMTERLMYANLKNSQPTLDEVSGLLVSLREAWASMPNASSAAA